MSCREKDQSAIAEVRDQLMLDTADDVRLDVVTSNLGLDRPSLGIDDDEWRALVKAIGLQPKAVRNSFHKIMEICAGPRRTRIFNLSSESEVADNIIDTANGENLVQLGTLIIDPGLPSEEEVSFCFRDLVTRKVYLSTSLTQAHIVIPYASSHLSVTIPVGATTFVLDDVSAFPSAPFPMSGIIDQGTPTEELIVITGIDTGTKIVTIQSGTQYAHSASRSTFIQKLLFKDTFAGRDFVELATNATRVFPNSGFLRLNYAEVNAETQEYVSNDVSTNTLHLRGVLSSDHAAGSSVELVHPGAVVAVISGVQRGINWEIHETEPRKVKICVPESLISHRLIDLSFLHDVSPPAFTTSLVVPAVAGSSTITVVDASGFRLPTGAVYINGVENYAAEISDITGTVLTLTTPLTQSFGAGTSVAAAGVNYVGTDLEEGNLRQADGSIDVGFGFKPEFSGPYVYDALSFSPSLIKMSLTEDIPPSAHLVVAQQAGVTSVEVDDARMWPAVPFDPFTTRIGMGTGFSEIVTVTDVSYSTTQTTVASPTVLGATTIVGTSTALFPESSDGTHATHYRVRVGTGTANEEIAYVSQNSTGTNTLTLTALTQPHAAGETIELVADVITTSVLLHAHQLGARVDKLVDSIKVSNAAILSSSGTIWLNFGKAKTNARARIVHVVSSTTLIMHSTDDFPDTDYPYRVVVGVGTAAESFAFVSFNDKSLSTLSFTLPVDELPSTGDYVEFTAGVPEVVTYVAKDTDSVSLSTGKVFDSLHARGEPVHFSPGSSVPSTTGFDYPLKLPPSPIRCFVALIDFVRAAGVEVILVEDCAR
jgi:uncharacterized protein YqfB (UPF0267 family)